VCARARARAVCVFMYVFVYVCCVRSAVINHPTVGWANSPNCRLGQFA
jgi:hypothetical protein